VPVYLSIKAAETLPPETHELLSRIADAHGLTLHANTRNAALRPPYTCKAEACRFLLEEVIERQPEDTLIALGDSLSDLRFMAMSDVAVMPTRSQLWNSVKDLAQ
jgi:predicted mannosyl-3-phosphoglycerate phosphatase (HAD superfamily)